MEQNKILQDVWTCEFSDELHYIGCCYGIPDGPDDFVNECECEELRKDLHDTRVIKD